MYHVNQIKKGDRVISLRSKSELRFQLRHMCLDSRFGNIYMRVRSNYAPYRAVRGASLLIEGFPRSANTYAYFAAQSALGEQAVRGHTHAASNVIAAVRLNIPSIVIVRNPDDAVASLVQQARNVTPKAAFEAYIRFHKVLLRVKHAVYVAPFSQITDDFGAVMTRANHALGSTLPVYVKTEAAENEVFRRIDRASAERNNGIVRERGVARPSSARRSTDEVFRNLKEGTTASRMRAQEVFREIMET